MVTLRPFNTYGPRQSARAVIPTIITQIAAGQRPDRPRRRSPRPATSTSCATRSRRSSPPGRRRPSGSSAGSSTPAPASRSSIGDLARTIAAAHGPGGRLRAARRALPARGVRGHAARLRQQRAATGNRLGAAVDARRRAPGDDRLVQRSGQPGQLPTNGLRRLMTRTGGRIGRRQRAPRGDPRRRSRHAAATLHDDPAQAARPDRRRVRDPRDRPAPARPEGVHGGRRLRSATSGHLIRAYVGDGSQWGVEVDYATEDQPLGHDGTGRSRTSTGCPSTSS